MTPFSAARRVTRRIRIGSVEVGGGAPVSVQTMTKTDTRDVAATLAQIREVAAAGCDIVRLAVPDDEAAKALAAIRRESPLPIVADIHFRHTLAVRALEAGVDGLRINPGNIGGAARVREVVAAARERRVPIRIGVNGGSLEKELLARFGGPVPEALVESAMGHVRLLEEADYREIKISVKASDVPRTVAAYRLLAERTDYPLHVGVTEAGTFLAGTVRSSVGIGILLAEGIGDTIRVSLTDTPLQEVRVGLELLRSLGLKPPGARVTACPTCGRTRIDVRGIADRMEVELESFCRSQSGPYPHVAVMGCVVNGPGEAREADIAVAGGEGMGVIYVKGEPTARVAEAEIVKAMMDEVRRWKPGN
ncbi:MAG: flavodoxin-dependent (E)-4-hydroxy-3-methylbut-2-enyl-diphosphate synthase [Kiritimatiellia bacterium]